MLEKKTIFTLNIDDYAPEITALTYPLIEAYARKIGADFHIIRDRKFPEWPLTYEKLQIYELAQQMKNDWNIYIDSDCLVHPDTPDLTLLLPRDTVAHFGHDFAPVRWRSDRFFKRDGRNIGSGNWLAVASDLCIDLWKPLDDLTPEQAIANITPSVIERVGGIIVASHLIDDYALSRNIAKYSLKFKVFKQIFADIGYKDGGGFFYHHYLYHTNKKLIEMKKYLQIWKVDELMGWEFDESPIDKAEKIPGWMTRPELEWLYEKAKDMESVVEIGSFKGRSTFALCSACPGSVYAIDPFNDPGNLGPVSDIGEIFEDFLKNVGHFTRLTVLKRSSSVAASTNHIPDKVDMIFVDGDHTYEGLMSDLKNWSPRAKKLLCGHDLDDKLFPGVRQALYEYFGADKVVSGPGSLWFIK